MAFYRLSKLPFASPQTLQNPPNPPNTVPSRHPRAKATSRTGTPGPRPQQWLSIGFQSCRLPARKPSKTLQTLQTPSPAGTPGPRPLPEQAPQGQGHSNGFLWAFKAAVCQPANAPNPPKPSKASKPSKTLQTLQTPSLTGTPVPRPLLKQAPQGLPAFKPLKCSVASLQTLKTPKTFKMLRIPRGSFHQALPFAGIACSLLFACTHTPLLLGRSSLPFASLQTLKMLRCQPSNP